MPSRTAQRELAAQTRMWAAYERSFTLSSGRTISRHMRRGADGYELDGLLGLSMALEDAGQEWFRILVPHYTTTGKAFGARTFQRIGLKSPFEDFDDYLMAWVQDEGLMEAKALAETTMMELRALIDAGRGEGMSSRAIARLIRKQAPALSRARSVVIARTETHNAATFAGQEAARATGLEMRKQWLAHDNPKRTRDTHYAMLGSDAIPLDEPYIVGGYQMMRPGDGSLGAPAGEIAQCRCGEVHEVV